MHDTSAVGQTTRQEVHDTRRAHDHPVVESPVPTPVTVPRQRHRLHVGRKATVVQSENHHTQVTVSHCAHLSSYNLR